jgi:hypothetical protein
VAFLVALTDDHPKNDVADPGGQTPGQRLNVGCALEAPALHVVVPSESWSNFEVARVLEYRISEEALLVGSFLEREVTVVEGELNDEIAIPGATAGR